MLAIALVASIGLPALQSSQAAAAPVVNFTILHTNDFHGNLELAGSNPGAARVAQKIADVRTVVGDENVLVFDAGDIMQGSLLSNIEQGLPTIDYYRTIGYDAVTLGNHEFDWGQSVLGDRIAQAVSPAAADEDPIEVITANITKKVDEACTWTPMDGVTPYEIFTVGTAPDTVNVGVIGVGSVETPYITIADATEGLCFRDPFDAIAQYYAAVDAASDVIVVLSHNGWLDGGYGYGFTVYGDQTLAKKLNDGSMPVDLIIGGHSHTNIAAPYVYGETTVVQAYYAGRQVGRADVTVDLATGEDAVEWSKIVVGTGDPEYPPVQALVQSYVTDPAYQALITQPVGYAQVDLPRNYNGDSMMGAFIQDAIYGALNTDAAVENDVDLVFNNPGGIRTDWCDKEDPPDSGIYVWSSDLADCSTEGLWTHDPMLLTYGHMFQILPFGNATVVGDMTGAQIVDLLNQSATLFKGALSVAGVRHGFYRYSDIQPGPQPYAWGAYDIEVYDPDTDTWDPLDAAATYRVATNEFLAPAGQDGFIPFKYMTNITYWGDMLNQVNQYVSATYTVANPYRGPDGDGTLDGRVTRDGDGDNDYEPEVDEIVPVTILHHNDSHGRLLPTGTYPGYTNLVTLINEARLHNPARTLLLTAGDNIQGDSMMYYFKSAGLGYAADGTVLPADLQINPLIKAFNAVGYDAMTLGNHEFNFGSEVFGTLAQADFPMLQANIADDGSYGLADVPVEPYTTVTVDGIDIAILGIGNHRVPSYELPSNIPGLTFTNPITTGQSYAPTLAASHDAVVALTHVGFTMDPSSVEVDENVDTVFAAQVPGVDAVIGGHSHTNPVYGFGDYKFLPTFVAGPDGTPVLVTQMQRYNAFLGTVALGMRDDGAGGYEVASTSGRYQSVTTSIAEDPTVRALVQPYQDLIDIYNNTVIGSTTEPIDTLAAYTQETNGANLQADSSVWKLETEGIPVDVHLSGAMTNRRIAETATELTPYELKVADMFAAMPYENSLVVMEMNGPQLKSILERAYRYYYYKYVPGYGGYSHYTTCMLDTDGGNAVGYRDTYPAMPDGDNVASLVIGGTPVDFTDASTYYRVSTVNYLAAGACNFSDAGMTLWPLDQIVADTQYYVRDAVIEYVSAQSGPISPMIEGRLQFAAPTVATPVVAPSPSGLGESVVATATYSDPDPGSHTCDVDYGDGSGWLAGTVLGGTCTGPAHAYLDGGPHTVTVRVRDQALLTGTASTTHVVWFDFEGFYPPVRDGQATLKAGASLAVKFSLGGDQGLDVLIDGPQVSACGVPFSDTDPTASGKLTYSTDDDQYVFVWKTDKAWKNTCQTLRFDFVDGTTQGLDVTFPR